MAAAQSLGAPEVAVLGGGFGGLYTALRLCELDWPGCAAPRVTLVDRNECFSFSPMLYELATGDVSAWEVAPRYADILSGTDIQFVQGDVRSLDAEGRLVGVAPTGGGTEQLLPYDCCVLALGGEPVVGSVPGSLEHALRFHSADDALALRRRLAELRAGNGGALRIAVVGGGYIGVELAANLASGLGGDEAQITMVQRGADLLPAATEFARTAARHRLLDAGIELMLETAVESVSPGTLTLQAATTDADNAAAGEARELRADLVLWTAGSRPSPLAAGLGVPTDARGRVVTDQLLRVKGMPNLYALGDGAATTDAGGVSAPPTAQAAMQQANYVGWNMRADLRGQRGLSWRYADLGEMVSLGGDEAAVSALGLLKLKGPLASASRRAVYAARMPTPKQAAKVGASWAVDQLVQALRRRQGG